MSISPLTASLEGNVYPYPDKLLDYANTLAYGEHPGVSVLVAMMACELATERAMFRLWTDRGFSEAQIEAFDQVFRRSSLNDENVRKLFDALVGSPISQEPWWQAWKKAATLRNKIAHSGLPVEEAKARDSVVAARQLVDFLRRVVPGAF